jgi:replicative DNA helicase
VFDHASVAEAFEVSKIEVPYPTLARCTNGGIGPGELWYLAARLGQGKTWELLGYAAKAAKAGYSVGIASLEMPHKQVIMRSLKRLAGRDASLVRALNDDDVNEVKKAMDTIQATTPGRIDVFDPGHGRINTTSSIAEMCHDYDLVLVDHAGLLMTSDGRRAIDDWRAMAVISNVLREITLATGTPILAAAQINREGEKSHSSAPPKASNLSQSDALGQDADVVITMKRLSDRVMVHSAEKVRNGPNLRWYSRFEPDKARFEEISRDEASELGVLDEDRKASVA